MIQTPRDVSDYPGRDLRGAAAAAGCSASPLGANEPCPVLFRDVGPDGLASFFEGSLRSLAAPGAALLFLRAAGAPSPGPVPEEFGELVLLQPMTVLPWRTETAGIYVASGDAMPRLESIGFVPPASDRRALSAAASTLSRVAEWRDHVGGDAYDARCREALERVRSYREERSRVDALAAPLRLRMKSDPEEVRAMGFTEEELFAPWFSFGPERRREILDRISRVHLG